MPALRVCGSSAEDDDERRDFGADGLNRLTGWTLNGTPETYAYDATTGNLAAKGGVNYTYNSGHAHGVSSLSDGSSYQYDANGNMTQRVVGGQTFNLGYDAENRLVAVSGALTASFAYDGDGKRVKSTIGGTMTYFVGNIYESTGGVGTKYYYAGTTRIAMRVGTGDPYYILTDHLGSTTVTTDAAGNLVSELKYKPWGEVRSGSAPTSYTFTGQYSNTGHFGLMFYEARWYDVGLGRFASADSLVPAGAQGHDRYAYVSNSPVNYTDPTGHFVVEEDKCTALYCSGDPERGPDASDVIRRHERDRSPWEQLTYQERRILGAAGIGAAYWQDTFFGTGHDIGGTMEDPAVYVAVAVALGITGLPQHVVTLAVSACLSNLSCAGAVARTIGLTVYRVWGGGSGPNGVWWTPLNPLKVQSYADKAGLPTLNSGEYLSVGRIFSMVDVAIKYATKAGGHDGGLLSYVIDNPETAVWIDRISLVIPSLAE